MVVFFGLPTAVENKSDKTADISLPMYCRNAEGPVYLAVVFQKDNHPVKAADSSFSDDQGNFIVRTKADCLEKSEMAPTVLHVPAGAVSEKDRSLKAEAFASDNGQLIANTKLFDVHIPKSKRN